MIPEKMGIELHSWSANENISCLIHDYLKDYTLKFKKNNFSDIL